MVAGILSFLFFLVIFGLINQYAAAEYGYGTSMYWNIGVVLIVCSPLLIVFVFMLLYFLFSWERDTVEEPSAKYRMREKNGIYFIEVGWYFLWITKAEFSDYEDGIQFIKDLKIANSYDDAIVKTNRQNYYYET